MSKTTAIEWRPVEDINNICADISLNWISKKDGVVTARMHFSRITGAPAKDLLLTFQMPIGMHWEDEGPFGLESLPPISELPKLGTATFPLLILKPSPWADKYSDVYGSAFNHYALISLNDLVEVLAKNATAEWIDAEHS